jgi:uncharacterized repeat protein (TIGR03803 family)
MKISSLVMSVIALAPLAAHAQWGINDVFDFTYVQDGVLESASSLTMGSDGNLYGITSNGGTDTRGTVYKLALSWSGDTVTTTYSLLHSFTDGTDGGYPLERIVEDNSGNFYGTADAGGSDGDGVVFEISASGVFSVIYNFTGGTTDGCGPAGGLTIVNSGSSFTLYGTTAGCGSSAGYGNVFKLKEVSGTWTETILHAFAGGTKDGRNPNDAMILASDGNLYGTTESGGASGDGSVFQINPNTGAEAMIYSFVGANAPNGNGVTELPGASSLTLFGASPNGGMYDGGALYKLVEGTGGKFTYSIVHNFDGGSSDGAAPGGNLIYSATLGYFFGTTSAGGTSSGGTFYSLTPAGVFSVVNSLTGGPHEGPIWGPNNCEPCVFGTTRAGGASDDGMVWNGISP